MPTHLAWHASNDISHVTLLFINELQYMFGVSFHGVKTALSASLYWEW